MSSATATRTAVTLDDLNRAADIVRAVLASFGTTARFEVRPYWDPDEPAGDAIELLALVEHAITAELFVDAIGAVGKSLIAGGFNPFDGPVHVMLYKGWR